MACCGCFCIFKSCSMVLLDIFEYFWYVNDDLKRTKRMQVAQSKRICLTSTFFGLEEPCLIPPNLHLTGPNVKPQNKDLMAVLKEKDLKIYDWLQEAES